MNQQQFEAIKILRRGKAEYNEDGSSCRYEVLLKAPTPQVAQEYARRQLSYHCGCSYDCCAHWQRSAQLPRRSKRKEYRVHVWAYMNI